MKEIYTHFQNNEKFIRDIRIDKSRERNIARYLGLGKWDRERILPGYITEQLLLLTVTLGRVMQQDIDVKGILQY